MNLIKKSALFYDKIGFNSLCTMSGLQLNTVIEKLNEFAPEKVAEKWDNVGLLIEPYTKREIKNILLTNDLTETVLFEALEKSADMIISYHPLIFAPLKRITQNSWKEKIVSICLENKIALYCPHTSWDCVSNGVNDWLANSLPVKSSKVIQGNVLNPSIGAGRLCEVIGDLTLKEAIDRIKKYTGLKDVQIGIAVNGSLDSKVKAFAVCAGSGTSVLKDVKADLYLTGEMSHHDVLDANHKNIHVILLNHSNSERGFLKVFKEILSQLLSDYEVTIEVSEKDQDPLSTI